MNNLNNKGFTLVELLAVIVILVIITSIAIPSINSSIERTSQRQIEGKKKLIVSATELYLSDHKSFRKTFYSKNCYVDVQKSLVSDYIDVEDTKYNNESVGNYVFYDSSSKTIGVVQAKPSLEECK